VLYKLQNNEEVGPPAFGSSWLSTYSLFSIESVSLIPERKRSCFGLTPKKWMTLLFCF